MQDVAETNEKQRGRVRAVPARTKAALVDLAVCSVKLAVSSPLAKDDVRLLADIKLVVDALQLAAIRGEVPAVITHAARELLDRPKRSDLAKRLLARADGWRALPPLKFVQSVAAMAYASGLVTGAWERILDAEKVHQVQSAAVAAIEAADHDDAPPVETKRLVEIILRKYGHDTRNMFEFVRAKRRRTAKRKAA